MVSNILNILKPKQSLDTQGSIPFDRPASTEMNSFQDLLKTEITRSENRDLLQGETANKTPETARSTREGQSPEPEKTREDSRPVNREQSGNKNRLESRDETASQDKKPAKNDAITVNEKKEPVNPGLSSLNIKKALTPGAEIAVKVKDPRKKKTGITTGAEALASAMNHAAVSKQNVIKPVNPDASDKSADKVMKDAMSRGANAFTLAGMKGKEITGRSINDRQNTIASMIHTGNTGTGEQVKNKVIKKDSTSDKKEENAAIENRPGQAKNQVANVATPFTSENENSRQRNDRQQDGNNNFSQQVKGITQNGQSRNLNAARETRPLIFQENLDRIMDSARVVVRDGRNASLSMRLNPAELGSVTVNLGLEKGVLNARFLVDNADVRDAVVANLEGIRQELEQSGVSVGEFQVNVRDGRAFDRRNDTGIFSHFSTADKRETVDTSYNYASLPLHEGGINYVI